MNQIFIQVSDLSIRRNNISILKSVNWTVGKGKHWIILGANGSGKTRV